MISRRDLLMELRDGVSGVEMRLVRGTRDGFPDHDDAGLHPWLPLAQGDGCSARLLATAAAFRENISPDTLREHGFAIWNSLHDCHREELLRIRKDARDPVRRVGIAVVRATASAPRARRDSTTARDLWVDVVWECLAKPGNSGGCDRPKIEQSFFILNNPDVDWAFRRVQDPREVKSDPSLPRAPVRILLLVTSLHAADEETARRLAASASWQVSSIRAAFARNQEIRLEVAASRHDLESCPDTDWCFPDNGARVDHHFGDEDELRALVSSSGCTSPWHGLILLGHSDAEQRRSRWQDPQAQDLIFWMHSKFPETVTSVRVSVDTLRAWLPESRLALALAMNCASTQIGWWLLELAPHVIATTAMAGAQAVAEFVASLFSNMLNEDLLSTAFLKAKRGIGDVQARQLVTHLSTSFDDVGFLGPTRRSLLEHQGRVKRSYEMLELPKHRHQGVRLERVRIDLHLRSLDEHESWLKTRDLGMGSHGDGRVTFEDLLRNEIRTWILRGVAGAGKSTTLRDCALRPPVDRVPIYLHLPIWLSPDVCSGLDFADSEVVLESISTHLGVPRIAESIVRIAAAGLSHEHSLQPAFLLDAFDELDEEQRSTALEAAKTLATRFAKARVVISARETATIDVEKSLGAGWHTARLLPLDEQQQLDLVRLWHEARESNRAPKDALDAIRNGGDRVSEMCGNPLLLTLLINLQLGGFQDFARGQHGIMQSVLDSLLLGKWTVRGDPKPGRKLTDTEALRRLLQCLSWHMLQRKEGSPRQIRDRRELKTWLEDSNDCQGLKASANELKRQIQCNLDELMDALASESPFLPEHATDQTHWTFVHNFLQEALCAEHWWFEILKQDASDQGVNQAIQHLEEQLAAREDALDFWTEPVALLAGWMGSDLLVRRLLENEKTIDLGLRAMRAIDTLSAETARFALQRLPAWGPGSEESGPRVTLYEILAERTKVAAEPLKKDLIAVLLERAGVVQQEARPKPEPSADSEAEE